MLGADILFFRDYHMSLIAFLQNQLKEPHDYCALVQPDRDRTLAQFLDKIGANGSSDDYHQLKPQLAVLGVLSFLR